SDPADLARDIAEFLHDVFRGTGRSVPGPSGAVNVIRSSDGGDFGDAVLLSHSVNERTRGFMGQPPKARLPRRLRLELESRGIRVFNPRGESLRDIQDVRQLLGALLECLDPQGALQAALKLRNEARGYLTDFRNAYATYAASGPPPTAPHGLAD